MMKNTIKKIIAAFFICAMVIGVCHVTEMKAEAKSSGFLVGTNYYTDDTYIRDTSGKIRTGWIRVGKDIYYAHKTKSRMYPKGSVCKHTFRLSNGKVFYFDEDGKMLQKSSRCITVGKDFSVCYVYSPGIIRRYRWNARTRHYEYLEDDGTWSEQGQQCYPEGMFDYQY